MQQLVQVSALKSAFDAIYKILFSDHCSIIGPFLEDYLNSKLLSKRAFSVAIHSDLGSKDAVFDAFWTSPSLCFVLACTNKHDVPMPWLIGHARSCYNPHEVMRISPLCPKWQSFSSQG